MRRGVVSAAHTTPISIAAPIVACSVMSLLDLGKTTWGSETNRFTTISRMIGINGTIALSGLIRLMLSPAPVFAIAAAIDPGATSIGTSSHDAPLLGAVDCRRSYHNAINQNTSSAVPLAIML